MIVARPGECGFSRSFMLQLRGRKHFIWKSINTGNQHLL